MSANDTSGELGPVQMLAVGFDHPDFQGAIMAEFRRLREAGLIRLIDLLVVAKGDDGEIAIVETTDLTQEESMQFGAIVGALVGLGAAGIDGMEAGAELGAAELADGRAFSEDEVWYVADAIPPGTVAAIALIEHRWAIGLRDAIASTGGIALVDEWIHPADLIAAGAAAAASAR